MGKPRLVVGLIGSAVAVLGLVAFGLCIGAEFTRMKEKDVKLDGTVCYLPGSGAFGLGAAALICLFGAQMIGNVGVCTKFCAEKRSCCNIPRRPKIVPILLLVSWISFGVSSILLGTAASMNRKQLYGRGWLDGKCYLVRDGVFIGSAVLVVLTVSATLASLFATARESLNEGGRKAHAQTALVYSIIC